MRQKGGGGRGGSVTADDGTVWEEPPPITQRQGAGRGRRSSMWTARLVLLMERPGQWAKIAGYEKPSVAHATPSTLKRHPHWLPAPVEEWEFTTRVIDGTGYVYARYIGPNGKEQA